ncbi:DUF4062 domain-containing protein [Corallococcus exercitus]|uniref:DUF4062 domain-containing protein n=1 Tax=Corallococcus exercitus TaxID=2316736 RepID=UPI0035D50696
MAIPRIFISSTYYDLKYIRSSLELFISTLGYEAVLSERGDVTYTPDQALDQSCYREVQSCDIYVLIVGGRYGSEASATKTDQQKTPSEHYESITRTEYRAAIDKDIPVYILIEKSVNAEYVTYLKNKNNNDISYAHVDSVNVFRFIEEIFSKPRNNPVYPFDKYSDIEEWLRLQWAGLFRELLLKMSTQQQISSIAAQVSSLTEISQTLRHYLEEVVSTVSPQKAESIIDTEKERLSEAKTLSRLKDSGLTGYVHNYFGIKLEDIKQCLLDATTSRDLFKRLSEKVADPKQGEYLFSMFTGYLDRRHPDFLRDLDEAFRIVGRQPFDNPTHVDQTIGPASPRKKPSRKKASRPKT